MLYLQNHNNLGISPIKFDRVKRTPPALEVEYINDSTQKIQCKDNYGYDKVDSKQCRIKEQNGYNTSKNGK